MNRKPDGRRAMPGASPAGVWAVAVLVFVAELALLAVLAVAGARLGHGAWAVILATVLPLATVVIWGARLAPKAGRRLPFPMRLAVKLVVVTVASALLAVSGQAAWAALFLLAAGGLFTAGELRERTGPARS